MPRLHTPIAAQRGVTLIELMVGIALGLMVVAVASVALMSTRSITGTVSESTTLQQQASYAFNVIGRQIRQAGSIELNLNPNFSMGASGTFTAMEPVAFDAPDPTGARPTFNRNASTVTGTSTPTLLVGYQNYIEKIVNPSNPAQTITESLLRDCLGQNPGKANPALAPVISSQFQRNTSTNELACVGTGATAAQPIIENVTDFRVRYALQPTGAVNMQYTTDPATIANWGSVYAVEVCLEFTGTQPIGGLNGQTYKNCAGNDTSYGERLKMVFRSTYQLRSQGLAG